MASTAESAGLLGLRSDSGSCGIPPNLIQEIDSSTECAGTHRFKINHNHYVLTRYIWKCNLAGYVAKNHSTQAVPPHGESRECILLMPVLVRASGGLGIGAPHYEICSWGWRWCMCYKSTWFASSIQQFTSLSRSAQIQWRSYMKGCSNEPSFGFIILDVWNSYVARVEMLSILCTRCRHFYLEDILSSNRGSTFWW